MEKNKLRAPNTCQYSMSNGISKMYWDLLKITDGNVLDIGSGRGGFGLSKPSAVKLYGVERDPSIATQCENYELITVGDAENISSLELPSIKYKGVLARDILEHLHEPWNLLDYAYKNMESGGILICSVPKPDPKIVWNDYTHIRGFTKSALKSMLENSGFTVEKIFPMSGYTLATKLGIEKYLPLIASFPLIGRMMISWHAIARKDK